MDLADESAVEAPAVAEAAVETSTQDVTEGSPSSGEAADERSPQEIARDEFLKVYGEEEPKAQEAPPAEPEPKPEDTPAERQEGASEKVRLTDEEFKALPPKAQQRIGYLSDQLARAKKEVETTASQIDGYKEDHEALQRLRDFAEDNNLRSEDVTKGLAMMAHLQNGNFEKFLAGIQPFYDMAMQATGKSVSPDIQAMVDAGEITPEAAIRMTKAEQAKALAESAAARERQRYTAMEETGAQQARVSALQSAARSIEAVLRTEDTAYALKEPAIRKQFSEWLTEVRDELKAIHTLTPEMVSKKLRAIHASIALPAPAAPLRPTTARPDASTASRQAPPPKNSLEAMERFPPEYPSPR